eukprot:g14211.t1
MTTYTPLDKNIRPQLAELQQFLSHHTLEKIPSEDCSSLLRSLSSLCTFFSATLNTLTACAYDPVKAVYTIREAGEVVSCLMGIGLIPLPPDHMGLSLPDKLKYVIVEEYNCDVRVLLRIASPLIACADSIQQCLGEVGGTVDMGVCEGVHREGQALLQTLGRLAPQQKKALELVREYDATPPVSADDIVCAEYDVSFAQLAARKP